MEVGRVGGGMIGKGPMKPSGVHEMFFILIGGGFTSLFIHKDYLSHAHYCFMLDLNKEVKTQKQKTHVPEPSLWGPDWGRAQGPEIHLVFTPSQRLSRWHLTILWLLSIFLLIPPHPSIGKGEHHPSHRQALFVKGNLHHFLIPYERWSRDKPHIIFKETQKT